MRKKIFDNGFIIVFDNGRRSLPPKGRITRHIPFKRPFSAIEIPQINELPQLRPECVRQPLAEGRVLSIMKARAQGRTSINIPLNPTR
jgi:hypothetical protein